MHRLTKSMPSLTKSLGTSAISWKTSDILDNWLADKKDSVLVNNKYQTQKQKYAFQEAARFKQIKRMLEFLEARCPSQPAQQGLVSEHLYFQTVQGF